MAAEFINDDFLLGSQTARKLYHECAEGMPIYDYHCHLPAKLIADDHRFENITQAWLYGDHYKWRAMRANGISEDYITGKAGDEDKFEKWAATVPYTVRNPLYHWTHLELKRYFGIDLLLSPENARTVFEACSEMLKSAEFSVRNLLRKMNVKLVCTTEDPTDTLEDHSSIRGSGFEIRVHAAFRPDKALAAENPVFLNKWLDKLSAAADVEIGSFSALLDALRKRHDYFHKHGCRLSDYGLEIPCAEDYLEVEIKEIFDKIRAFRPLEQDEILKYKSAVLYEMARMDAESGWVMQLHVGALRNCSTRMFNLLGPDTGYDTMGDGNYARPLARFLDRLDTEEKLPKTILYNLNPKDNAMLAAMIGNFQNGSTPGKMQYGSGWWFLDQKNGIESQIEALSNMGLLSRFIGMLTDSRSFLSFPRHEYFRRILCSILGSDVENGLLPNNMDWLGKIIRDICYNNAKNYFPMDCP